MVSTPNAPEGLFEKIEQEQESTCLYRRLYLDYAYGLNKIYTGPEIQAAKTSPSSEREYNLKYLGLIGNVFHTRDIESVGLDPGFGSSNFDVCITELRDGLIHVLHAQEHTRPSFDKMIDITVDLLDKYSITFDGRSRIFVDGAFLH